MIDLNKFTESAKKTESKVTKVYANKDVLDITINIIVHAAEILDQLKKNMYYEREFDTTKMHDDLLKVTKSVEALNLTDITYVIENKEEIDDNVRLLHAKIGIATEAAELLQSGDDDVNFAEEIGDIMWYSAIGLDELDISFEDTIHTVIKKLEKRYENKFSNDAANNRDLNQERGVLNRVKTKGE